MLVLLVMLFYDPFFDKRLWVGINLSLKMGKGKGGGKSNKLFKISPDIYVCVDFLSRRRGMGGLLSRSFLNFCVYVCLCSFMLNNPDIFINLLNFCKIVEKFKFLERFFNRKLYSRDREKKTNWQICEPINKKRDPTGTSVS